MPLRPDTYLLLSFSGRIDQAPGRTRY
jgi:hypothetical protein